MENPLEFIGRSAACQDADDPVATPFNPFVRNFSATCEEVCPGGLCPRAAKTEYSSRERQQGFKTKSVLAPKTVFHLPAMRVRRVRRVDRDSLLPFNKEYPEPGGGRRTIRTHLTAALGQRPPRATRPLFGCGRQAALGI